MGGAKAVLDGSILQIEILLSAFINSTKKDFVPILLSLMFRACLLGGVHPIN